MLGNAIEQLSEDEHPIIHSDRGCHYRWPGWIERMNTAGLIRSMSKKGCSPDNSACEGVFGRLKNEMFYYVSWAGVLYRSIYQCSGSIPALVLRETYQAFAWRNESSGI